MGKGRGLASDVLLTFDLAPTWRSSLNSKLKTAFISNCGRAEFLTGPFAISFNPWLILYLHSVLSFFEENREETTP